jgi:hypothetical protein
MEDGPATGYSSRVEIESHNSPLERYASIAICRTVECGYSRQKNQERVYVVLIVAS